MQNAVAIILGGGKGTRLHPLTKDRSKPAVPIGGKYRLIDIPISNCLNSNINRIYVVTQYLSSSLHRHINQTFKFDYFGAGFVEILAAEQTAETMDWYRGTADAVRRNLKHIFGSRSDYVLILGGDQLYRMDFQEVIRYHAEKKADITVAVLPVEESRTSGLGILKPDADLRIVDFLEKPDASMLDGFETVHPAFEKASGRRYLASMGIYLFSHDVLVELLTSMVEDDFGTHIIPASLAKYKVFGFPFNDYWEDIGTIRTFFKANLDLAIPDPPFSFYRVTAPIYSHPRFLPCSKFIDCDMRETLLAEGCLVRRARILHSVIGIRSIIGEGSTIEHTLMMGADYYESPADREANHRRGIPDVGIGQDCNISNAIIDKNARIGKNVVISNPRKLDSFDGRNYYIRDSVVIIPKNAIIDDGTEI
ncbi:MAG: glucose-1-phosphate adenylyltransferase [Acidobacteriota bacterium]